jgi:hypothetical protein
VGLGAGQWLAIRPEYVEPVTDGGGATRRGPTVPVTIRESIFSGAITRVHSTLADGQQLVLHWPASEPLPASGASLTVTWPAERGVTVGE